MVPSSGQLGSITGGYIGSFIMWGVHVQCMSQDTEQTTTEPSPIVNYDDIRESLDLILNRHVDDETRREVLDNLDDATGNNADHLVLEDDDFTVVDQWVEVKTNDGRVSASVYKEYDDGVVKVVDEYWTEDAQRVEDVRLEVDE